MELQNHSLGPVAHFPIVPQTQKAIRGDDANRGGFDEKYGAHKLFLSGLRSSRAVRSSNTGEAATQTEKNLPPGCRTRPGPPPPLLQSCLRAQAVAIYSRIALCSYSHSSKSVLDHVADRHQPDELLIADDREMARAFIGHFFHGPMDAFILTRCDHLGGHVH